MTSEKAINMLHGIRADNLNLDDAYTKDKYEALDMAINALEQEPCEDWYDVPSDEITLEQARQAVRDLRKFVMDNHILPKLQPCEDAISRQAVLNLTKELRFNSVKGMEDYCYRCIEPYDVEELPPIQPKAKMGHWIKVVESYLPYMCSECGKSEFRKSNYCPNCGTEMQGVEK